MKKEIKEKQKQWDIQEQSFRDYRDRWFLEWIEELENREKKKLELNFKQKIQDETKSNKDPIS